MSGKRAKMKRRHAESMERVMETEVPRQQVPIAGCPGCKNESFHLEMDQMPPLHTEISWFICTNCYRKIEAGLRIKPDGAPEYEEIKSPVTEDLCEACEFHSEDCQC
jgi:hypothetical protein